jgi:hypothetical protein
MCWGNLQRGHRFSALFGMRERETDTLFRHGGSANGAAPRSNLGGDPAARSVRHDVLRWGGPRSAHSVAPGLVDDGGSSLLAYPVA